ncbi:MAG: quinolinate synthase NadA [Candidatus Electrothrix sp. AR5]|nr:quinolinate synthase NadA [Candidatus Electrothrix sp. AR5]
MTNDSSDYTPAEITRETERLHQQLHKLGWTREGCRLLAPTTLEINRLKKEQGAIILVHSYQTPDIMYGVADFIGDSYDLSRKASEHPAQKIIFSSVYFMGETAKLLNPEKEVLVPQKAGCSLADSITAEQVRELRQQHPEAGVVCYVNTYASVKAESDACCTSSNVQAVVEAMPQDEIIFIPDQMMGLNLRNMTSKRIIPWQGTCIVHDEFNENSIMHIRQQFPNAEILAHPECSPGIVSLVDFVGGTAAMLKHVQSSPAKTFMLVTECGLTDRFKAECTDKSIVGSCILCPYMKEIGLTDILNILKNPTPENRVELEPALAAKARACLDTMFALEKKAASAG